MKIPSFNQLWIVVLTGAMMSCSSSPPETVRMPVSSTQPVRGGSLSGQLFNGMNSYREQNGKSTLQRHSGLDQLAQQHCDALVKNCGGHGTNISHNGFDGRAFQAKKSFNIETIGENVVSSSTHSAGRLVELLASSKAHDRNMRSSWKYVGVATAVSPDGMVISTQIFGMGESMASTQKADPFGQHW